MQKCGFNELLSKCANNMKINVTQAHNNSGIFEVNQKRKRKLSKNSQVC